MTKPNLLYFLSALIFSLILASDALAGNGGQGRRHLSIGVADVGGVMERAKVSKSVRDQISDARQKWQTHYDELRTTLREEATTIEKNRDVLGEDKYLSEVKKWDEKLEEANRDFRSQQEQLEQLVRTKADEIDQVLGKVVAKIARQKEIDLVLNSSLVLTSQPRMNITEEILKEFDKTLSEVKLNLPTP